jgi:hypothetical protein
MKQFLAATFFALLMGQPLGGHAQPYYFYDNDYYYTNWVFEVGGGVGVMNALTDIGGRKGVGKGFIKDLTMRTSKPAFSLYLIGMYQEAFGIRVEGTFGTVAANDDILQKVAPSTFGRYERNLSFRSKITDIQVAAEIHPLFFKTYLETDPPRLSPYLLAGIGFFTFNPQASANGTWVALQPLRTEGQGFTQYPNRRPYALTQFNVPLGLGVRYEISSRLNARLEIVHRFLFTDYLDDVSTDYINPAHFNSNLLPGQAALATQLYNRNRLGTIPVAGEQRGDPRDNDSFFTMLFKLGIPLRTERRR